MLLEEVYAMAIRTQYTELKVKECAKALNQPLKSSSLGYIMVCPQRKKKSIKPRRVTQAQNKLETTNRAPERGPRLKEKRLFFT